MPHAAGSLQPMRRSSRGNGGYDFGRGLANPGKGTPPLWTQDALPSVIALTDLPEAISVPSASLDPAHLARLGLIVAADGPDRVIEIAHQVLRVHDLGTVDVSAGRAVLIPLDALVEVRAAALLRLFRAVTGCRPGPNPATLPAARRTRLVLALRALDARQQEASYREIAAALFGAGRVPRQGWKTHDLRDRTVRLVRHGVGLMSGGYRRLLLHPFRRKL